MRDLAYPNLFPFLAKSIFSRDTPNVVITPCVPGGKNTRPKIRLAPVRDTERRRESLLKPTRPFAERRTSARPRVKLFTDEWSDENGAKILLVRIEEKMKPVFFVRNYVQSYGLVRADSHSRAIIGDRASIQSNLIKFHSYLRSSD